MESRKQNRTRSNIKKMFKVIFKTFKFLFKFSLLAGIIVSLCIGFYITKAVHELPKVTENIIKNGTIVMAEKQTAGKRNTWKKVVYIKKRQFSIFIFYRSKL